MLTFFTDAERSIKKLKELTQQDGLHDNLLVNKYYAKALSLGDELLLGTEIKTTFNNFLLSEKINQDVLIKKYKHTKETIRLQLKKMLKFKQFMTTESFTEVSRKVM